LLLFWLTIAVSLACDQEPSPAELADVAIDAYRLGKTQAGNDAVLRLTERMACMTAPLASKEVAVIHRAFGLHASLAGTLNEAHGHFRAAKVQHGSWVPTGGDEVLWQEYLAVSPIEVPTIPMPRGSLYLVVDGSPTDGVPDGRPFLLQTYRADGALYQSGMYGPKAPYRRLSGPNLVSEKRARLLVNSGAITSVLGGAVIAGSLAKASALNDLSQAGSALPVGLSMAATGLLFSLWGLHAPGANESSNPVNQAVE
jgi:hypothetical protein